MWSVGCLPCPHALARADAPNLATGDFGEPDVAIRPDRNALRSAIDRRDTEAAGEAAAGRDAPDSVACEAKVLFPDPAGPHSTMSDLLSLQPNLDIDLYLVAPDERRNKVQQEILRPTFELREKPLSRVC